MFGDRSIIPVDHEDVDFPYSEEEVKENSNPLLLGGMMGAKIEHENLYEIVDEIEETSKAYESFSQWGYGAKFQGEGQERAAAERFNKAIDIAEEVSEELAEVYKENL